MGLSDWVSEWLNCVGNIYIDVSNVAGIASITCRKKCEQEKKTVC